MVVSEMSHHLPIIMISEKEVLGMVKMAVHEIRIGDWAPSKENIDIDIENNKVSLSCVVDYTYTFMGSLYEPPEFEDIEYKESIEVNESITEEKVYNFVEEYLKEAYLKNKKSKHELI